MLIEIALIAIACWAVVEFLPLVVDLDSATSAKQTLAVPVMRIDLTSEGRQLWIQRGRNEILALDLDSQKVRRVHFDDRVPIRRWSVSRDGSTWLLLQGQFEISIYENGEQIVFDREEGSYTVDCLLSADGQTAVSICDDLKIRAWDLSTPSPVVSEFVLPESGHKFAIDPIGRLFVSSRDGEIQAYETRTGTAVWSMSDSQPLSRPPVFSTDGRWILLSHGDDLQRVDFETKNVIWSLPFDVRVSEGDGSLAISPDGARIAIKRPTTEIQLIDSLTGQSCTPCLPNSEMHRAVFSRSGSELFSSDAAGLLFAWRLSRPFEATQIPLSQ